MPEITNKTLYKYCAKRSELVNSMGVNWSSFDSAVVAMQTVLEEMGCQEMLTPEHKESRVQVAKLLAPLFTAGKNWQSSYLAKTPRLGADGKPSGDMLMQPATTIESKNTDEV